MFSTSRTIQSCRSPDDENPLDEISITVKGRSLGTAALEETMAATQLPASSPRWKVIQWIDDMLDSIVCIARARVPGGWLEKNRVLVHIILFGCVCISGVVILVSWIWGLTALPR